MRSPAGGPFAHGRGVAGAGIGGRPGGVCGGASQRPFIVLLLVDIRFSRRPPAPHWERVPIAQRARRTRWTQHVLAAAPCVCARAPPLPWDRQLHRLGPAAALYGRCRTPRRRWVPSSLLPQPSLSGHDVGDTRGSHMRTTSLARCDGVALRRRQRSLRVGCGAAQAQSTSARFCHGCSAELTCHGSREMGKGGGAVGRACVDSLSVDDMLSFWWPRASPRLASVGDDPHFRLPQLPM